MWSLFKGSVIGSLFNGSIIASAGIDGAITDAVTSEAPAGRSVDVMRGRLIVMLGFCYKVPVQRIRYKVPAQRICYYSRRDGFCIKIN